MSGEVLKVVLVGDLNVGKTSIMNRFIHGVFDEKTRSTISLDFGIKEIQVDGENRKIQVWDTAGQQKFRTITRAYYRRAAGILLVFDLTSRNSFENLPTWLDEINSNTPSNTVVFIVGNKKDAEGQISEEAIRNFCDKIKPHHYIYTETSAKDNHNINELFHQIVQKIPKTIEVRDQFLVDETTVKMVSGSSGRGECGCSLLVEPKWGGLVCKNCFKEIVDRSYYRCLDCTGTVICCRCEVEGKISDHPEQHILMKCYNKYFYMRLGLTLTLNLNLNI